MSVDLRGLGRTLHVVDVENLVGSPSLSPDRVARVWGEYAVKGDVGPNDQVVIATAHHGAEAAWFGWPDATRRLVGSGPDGADFQLLLVLADEDVAARFEHVVIGSGDGIFANAAARRQEHRVTVAVVSRPEAISRRLRLAVRDVRLLDCPAPVAGRALRAA